MLLLSVVGPWNVLLIIVVMLYLSVLGAYHVLWVIISILMISRVKLVLLVLLLILDCCGVLNHVWNAVLDLCHSRVNAVSLIAHINHRIRRIITSLSWQGQGHYSKLFYYNFTELARSGSLQQIVLLFLHWVGKVRVITANCFIITSYNFMASEVTILFVLNWQKSRLEGLVTNLQYTDKITCLSLYKNLMALKKMCSV